MVKTIKQRFTIEGDKLWISEEAECSKLGQNKITIQRKNNGY